LTKTPADFTEATCWAQGRRKLFELAEVARAPLTVEAVRRIDTIFDAERAIDGLPAEARLAVRQQRIAPLIAGSRPGCGRDAACCPATTNSPRRWITRCSARRFRLQSDFSEIPSGKKLNRLNRL